MTGPEHYTKAEQLLTDAATSSRKGEVQSAQLSLAAAHVHATLAQAAATALNDAEEGLTQSQRNEWLQATDTAAPQAQP